MDTMEILAGTVETVVDPTTSSWWPVVSVLLTVAAITITHYVEQRKSGAKTGTAVANAFLLAMSSMAVKEKMLDNGEKFDEKLKDKLKKEAEKRDLPVELVEVGNTVIDKINEKEIPISVKGTKHNFKIQDIINTGNVLRSAIKLFKKF